MNKRFYIALSITILVIGKHIQVIGHGPSGWRILTELTKLNPHLYMPVKVIIAISVGVSVKNSGDDGQGK